MTSSESPECDSDDLSIGIIFSVALCSLIVRYGAMVNGISCVCEKVFAYVEGVMMHEAVESIIKSALK